MRRAGGSIINTASTLGIVAMRHAVAYCAAKEELVQLTRAMALDHARDQIRANVVRGGGHAHVAGSAGPGGTTPGPQEVEGILHPLRRLGSPEDVAALALYLASDESAWMTEDLLTLDGGLTAL